MSRRLSTERGRGFAIAPIAVVALLLGALAAGCSSSGPHAANEIVVKVTPDGFVPEKSFAPRGMPATLVVIRQTNETCATQIVVAELNKTFDLPLNKPVEIQLPEGVSDTLHFACGMDMYHGVVIAK